MKKYILALLLIMLPSIAMAFPPWSFSQLGKLGGVNVWTGTNSFSSSAPYITFEDTTASAPGTGSIYTDAYTAGQDSIFSIYVDDSAGEDTQYFSIDGFAESVFSYKKFTTVNTTPQFILMDSSTNAAGTAGIYADAFSSTYDSVMSFYVDDSAGEDTEYLQLDGTNETVDVLKPLTEEGNAVLNTTEIASIYAPLASPALTGDPTITDATPTLTLQDSDNAAGTAGINFNSSGGANDIVATVGVEDSTGASTPYQQWDGVTETVDFLKDATLANGGVLRTSAITEGHTFALQVYDNTAGSWKPALTFTNGVTGAYKVTLGAGVTFDGLGSLSLGGIILGDADPDSAGELGLTSNTLEFFANSEDIDLTASSDLWTFSSETSATFAFTPAVAFTATASVGTVLQPDASDGATIGSTSLEWSDIYLADGGIIYFGNDQDVTLTHNADTGLTLNTSSFVTAAATDPYVFLNETDGTDWYVGVDDTGNTLEFRTNATVGNSVAMELGETGIIGFTHQDMAVTTEANIALTSTVLLITGDDDGDNDAIDLQNGTFSGQLLYIVAEAAVDANDTMTINMADTTCTNCAAVVFDKVGESASLVWTGTTWSELALSTGL